MSPLTATLHLDDPVAMQRHRTALATLPERLRIAAEPGADVVAIDGRVPGWPAAASAAIGAGARGIVVASPSPTDLEGVRRLAAEEAVVALESPVFDPTWRAALDGMRAAMPAASLVDVLLVTDRGLASGLVEQLMLVGSLAGALADVRGGSAGPTGYWISATSAGVPVNLAGIASPATPRLTVDVVSGHEQWRASFDRSAPARPTSVVRYDEHGARLRPEVYESAERALWRHLAAALTDGAPLPYTLGDLAGHLAAAAALSL